MKSAFSECRKDLIKDQLWTRFFDVSKDVPLTDVQVHDMLRFSVSYDLRTADDRYRYMLSLDLHRKSKYALIMKMRSVLRVPPIYL